MINNNNKKSKLLNFMTKYSAKIDLVIGLSLIGYGAYTSSIVLQMLGAFSVILSILAPVKHFKSYMERKTGKAL